MYFVLGLGCEKSESVVVCDVVGVVALEERESARECVDGDGEEGDQGREKRGEHNIFQGDSGHE